MSSIITLICINHEDLFILFKFTQFPLGEDTRDSFDSLLFQLPSDDHVGNNGTFLSIMSDATIGSHGCETIIPRCFECPRYVAVATRAIPLKCGIWFQLYDMRFRSHRRIVANNASRNIINPIELGRRCE